MASGPGERSWSVSDVHAVLAGERERIAKDLHDGVIQALFGVGMELSALAGELGDEAAVRRLQASVAELDQVICDIRQYIFSLRPSLLVGRHLAEAVRTLAADVEARTGILVVVELEDDAMASLASREADVVQIVREALSNVARHAGAETCRVTATVTDDRVLVEIDDDGHGFDVERARRGEGGVANIEARGQALGAKVNLSSGETGSAVTLEFPR